MSGEQILVVEDDKKMRQALCQILKKEGYVVSAVETGEESLASTKQESYDLVITDLKLSGIDGMEVLRAVRKAKPGTSVVIITAYATVDTAVKAMKEGAEDYVAKPFSLDEIRIIVKRVMEKRELLSRNSFLQKQLKRKYKFENIIGNSEPMQEVLRTISKIIDSKSTILVYGETGTGKELVARAVHYNSIRCDKEFLPVNCGALSENLLESELFGHVKGSFTGAVRDKRGLFEVAEGGTIFLDEVGDLSLGLQQKLLRVLEDGEIQPVGATTRKKVDVRVIAATNKNLEDLMKQRHFREDLFYRLNVVPIHLPPLREKKDDIAMLAHHFLKKYCNENHKEIKSISAEAMRLLEDYDWPGNVRELENAIERATLLETGQEIMPESLPSKARQQRLKPELETDEDLRTLEEVGKAYIIKVLEKTAGNKAKAAEILGINRTSLWRMMRRLKIEGVEEEPSVPKPE